MYVACLLFTWDLWLAAGIAVRCFGSGAAEGQEEEEEGEGDGNGEAIGVGLSVSDTSIQ